MRDPLGAAMNTRRCCVRVCADCPPSCCAEDENDIVRYGAPYLCPLPGPCGATNDFWRVTALLRFTLSNGATTLPALAIQAITDYLYAFAVVDGLQGTVISYPPGAEAAGTWVYPLVLSFARVIVGTCGTPVRLPQVAEKCSAFAAALTAQFVEQQEAYDGLVALVNELAAPLTVASLTLGPFKCVDAPAAPCARACVPPLI